MLHIRHTKFEPATICRLEQSACRIFDGSPRVDSLPEGRVDYHSSSVTFNLYAVGKLALNPRSRIGDL